jgi:protein-S-isoprenylcysteine O-methyltransferase Ste14
MAQTKRKRHTKHRGNAGGVIETRGRTGRPPSADEKKRAVRDVRRDERLSRKPTFKAAAMKGLLCGGFMFVFLVLVSHSKGGNRFVGALITGAAATLLYIGLAYYMDLFLWRRRMAKKQAAAARR